MCSVWFCARVCSRLRDVLGECTIPQREGAEEGWYVVCEVQMRGQGGLVEGDLCLGAWFYKQGAGRVGEGAVARELAGGHWWERGHILASSGILVGLQG